MTVTPHVLPHEPCHLLRQRALRRHLLGLAVDDHLARAANTRRAGVVNAAMARDEPQIMVNSVDPGFCSTDQNQNQGYVSAERGATTAVLLATLAPERFLSGRHWFEEREMPWTYQ